MVKLLLLWGTPRQTDLRGATYSFMFRKQQNSFVEMLTRWGLHMSATAPNRAHEKRPREKLAHNQTGYFTTM